MGYRTFDVRVLAAVLFGIGQPMAVMTTPLLISSPAAAQASCIQFFSGNISWKVTNFCNERINVRWRDQGYCASGCMEVVGALAAHSITPIKGGYTWCACWNYNSCCTP